MPTLKTQFIHFLLQHRHWFRGRLRPETVTERTDMVALRARTEKMAARLGQLDTSFKLISEEHRGVHAERLMVNAHGQALLLYFHGGGYTTGSASSHRGIVSKFVKASGVNALCFDYRLAPEHPFPAALDDSIAVYQNLLATGWLPESIVFCGDSAGGGLALATLLKLKSLAMPLPKAAVLLSPWVDLTLQQASYLTDDPLAPPGSWQVYGKWYARTHDKKNPLISPLYGDMQGLPPMFISVGTRENIHDEAVALMVKAEQAGVEVHRQIGQGMMHCYPAMAPILPEAVEALADIAGFIRQQLIENPPAH